MKKIVVGALVLGSLLGAASDGIAASPSALDRFYKQRMTWTDCGTKSQCASVTVPLDYGQPKGATIRIGLLRKVTAGPGAPSLLFNPGGPGGSGTDFVDKGAGALLTPSTPSVTAKFNFVGFDPRGVGRSTQLVCVTQEQIDAFPQAVPADAAGVAQSAAASAQVGAGCKRLAPRLTANIGTEMVARDLDIVRSALGESKLNYYGISYGTYIGMVYAHLFPSRVGRMVLDAVTSPTADMVGLTEGQTNGFESALRDWAADCHTRPTCPADTTWSTDQIVAWFGRIVTGLGTAPLASGSVAPVTQTQFLAMTQSFLSGGQGSGWFKLDFMLKAATGGDTALFTQYRDAYGANPDANFLSVNNAVSCFDRPASGTSAQTVARSVEWAAFAPSFGASFAWAPQPCFTWPVRHGGRPLALTPTTKASVLLVGGLHDPNTLYAYAQQTAKLFPGGRLLTWSGYGHGAGNRANTCVNDTAAAYLTTGALPPPGKVCSSA